MRARVTAGFAGAAVAALVTLPGLGNGTLWDNSETAYGEVAREVLLAHDWIVLHLNGPPWYVQPPLYFWIGALCAKIFGVGSFAMRLPAALATIAMGAYTAVAVARQAGLRAGIYASVVLSTCLMQAIVGRLAIMDALLDLAIAVTIFAWSRALQTGRNRYFVYGCVAVAFGVLAKGPVAPLIAILVLAAYAVWERRSGGFPHLPTWRGWIAGGVLFAAVAFPWFIALWSRQGSTAFYWLIEHYTIGRFIGTIQNQPGPLWYYLPAIVLGFFPWIVFLPSAIAFAVRHLRSAPAQEPLAQLLRLSLCWTVVPLLFFSLARTKLPNYIALEFPALAVLVALYLDAAVARVRSRSVLVCTAAVPVATLLVAAAVAVFSAENRLSAAAGAFVPDLIAIGAALFVGSVAAFALFWISRTARFAPYALGAAMTLAVGVLACSALPRAERFKPVPRLAHIINAHRRPGDAVAIRSIAGGNALLFYTRPHVFVIARKEDDPELPGVSAHSVVCGSPRIWMVAPQTLPGYDRTYGRSRRLVARLGKTALFLYDGARCGR